VAPLFLADAGASEEEGDMGIFGKPNVEKLEARRDVQGLLRALSYPKHSGVRRGAAEALGRIGDSRAVEPLIAALKDEDFLVRGAAAQALGEIGDLRAVEPLAAALKDEEHTRSCAADALWRLGTPAVEPLIAALKDEDFLVRRWAAVTLGHIGSRRAVEPLAATLKDSYPGPRGAAAEALGEIGDLRAVGPLSAALKDDDWNLRRAAAEALGRLGAPAVEPPVTALSDGDTGVHPAATEARSEEEGSVGWHNLRPTAGAQRCGNCLIYKSLDDYKDLARRWGIGHPLVAVYGYGPEAMEMDGICEVTGGPLVLSSYVCDRHRPRADR